MKLQPALYILDAYGLIYRSYFAFLSRPLLNSAGKNISALFGFARTVMMLIDEGAPAAGRDRRVKCLATVFDSLSPTFRHKKYPDYKATRQKAPEDLHEQVRLVEEFLSALGVPPLRVDGFEADDIIATLVKKCREDKRLCYIVSSDKDLLQLVGNGAWALRPRKSAPGDGNPVGSPFSAGLNYELVSADDIKEEWGVPPEKVLDLLSLVGDASDNIPGVKGIGEKTAVKLMARYGSLEEIYGNIAGIEGSVGKKLALGQENAFFARELIALDNNVPLAVDNLDQFSVENLNRTAGASMLLREGIRQIARQLDPKAQPSAEVPPAKTRIAASQVSGGGEASPKTAVDPDLLGPGTYRAVMDIAELEAIVKAGQKKGALALDFETDSLDAWNARPLGISIAIKSREAVYVPLAPHRGTRPGGMERAPFIEPEPVREILRPLFADPRMTIIAHNAKFDYKVSRGWGIPRWTCRIWDTMVAAWVDDSDRGNYSLDSLAAFHFEYTAIAYNDIVPRGGTFDQIDLDTAIRYAAEDADLCFRMKTLLEKRLAVPGSESLFYDLEMPLLPVLAEMEGTGIKIDPPALEQYGKELAEELRKIERKTYNTVGHEFNLGSTKQLQEVLFRERKLNPGKKTKTGYSTDMAVLEELARVDPVPALILRHRTLAKLRSTYVDTLAAQAGKNQRIHTHFVQTGTATGRLSSREPNLQNIPIRDEEGRRIRAAFIAEADQVLISADYSQIELVVLAHLSGDENLIAAFQEDKDVHARTAALIFGVREEDIDGNQRRIAKTINFGVMYGMSAYRLASELGISRTDATEFIAAYFRTYAGVKRLVGELIQKTEETGYASTILGRRRQIRAINSRNKTEKAAAERVAVNTPIQGSAADIVKTAMLKLDRRLAETASPARLLLQVHDELILECPKDGAEEAARLVRDVMENAVPLSVPLRVRVETGNRWGDFH